MRREGSSNQRWDAATLEAGEIDARLAPYGDDFRHWSMNKVEWTTLLRDTVPTRASHRVAVSELLLLGDPGEDDLCLSRFELKIGDADGDIEVMKRRYWRRAPDGGLEIVAEDAG